MIVAFIILVSMLLNDSELKIVVPADAKPFVVHSTDLVRIPASGVGGSTITFHVEGPTKMVRVNTVIERAAGPVVITGTKMEAETKAVGTGQVEVRVSVKQAHTGQETKNVYQYEVKP